MTKSSKLFRYIWRIDAILILVAGAVITVGATALLAPEIIRKSVPRNDSVIVNTDSDDGSSSLLQLGQAELVEGTAVLLADLQTEREGKGYSSGVTSETRNLLFIDPDQKKGRWLLPDNEHIIEDSTDIVYKPAGSAARTIATAALIKPARKSSDTGRLLLFDPTGKKVVDVAKDATQIRLATVSGNELILLFEQNNHLVRTTFDLTTLAQRNQQEIEIPKLK